MSAYSSYSAAASTQRGAEYETLGRITRSIRDSTRSGASFSSLAAALHENRRLWTILALDVSNDENPLPLELKKKIFILNSFVQKHTRRVLLHEASVAILLEINVSIMKGLREGR